MVSRSFVPSILKAVLISCLASAVSFGAVIYDSGVTSISANPSVQTGRLSRSLTGFVSQWANTGPFPGVANAGVTYGYEAFAIPVSPYSYLQVSIYDVLNSSNVFASAYGDLYSPTGSGTNLGLDTNYLGYAGQSGNLFNNPRAFQVILPNPDINNLVVVVNDTSAAGLGLRQPFQFLVEGFYDTNFNDTTAPVPEPSELGLSCGWILAAGIVGFARLRR